MGNPVLAACLVGSLAAGVAGVAGVAGAFAAPKPKKAAPSEVVKLLERLVVLGNAPGGVAPAEYSNRCRQARAMLAEKNEQDAFLRELPGLSPPQLVRLWDTLWLQQRDGQGQLVRLKDMNEVAKGLAGRLNEAVLAALPGEKDPKKRRILLGLIKPQAHTFTKEQAAAFKKQEARLK